MPDSVEAELQRRKGLWSQLLAAGGPKALAPTLLRELGVYGGAQGIWVDKARTRNLTSDDVGATVSVLHTGSAYPDDLANDGVIYHYPKTNRPAGRDLAEIKATKAAGTLHLPVFVIAYPSPASGKRDVALGWIEGWDDQSGQFLISFSEEQPSLLSPDVSEDEPFELTADRNASKREVLARKGQQRFKFRVFQRYRAKCVVCGLGFPELLDAAHIRPKQQGGSDDPRNGLVLCALHHRAMDAGLFAIEPGTLSIRFGRSDVDTDSLWIRFPTLEHLERRPHNAALEWAWENRKLK